MAIQNRLNITACQILVEIQVLNVNTPIIEDQDKVNPLGQIKATINQWINSYNGAVPPPKKSSIHALTPYCNKKLLIETNSAVTVVWMKDHCGEFLKSIFSHPVKILGRLYPVVARFMPIAFSTNDICACELENSAKIPAHSISHVTWIKNPLNRSPMQQYANVKIYCTSAEATNCLILATGQFRHLSSYLRIHKDIKEPNMCNRCQQYCHITTDCKEENPTCAKCMEDHFTSKCTSTATQCTPCGSNEHWTNSNECPEWKACKAAILNKSPKALSPYYITNK